MNESSSAETWFSEDDPEVLMYPLLVDRRVLLYILYFLLIGAAFYPFFNRLSSAFSFLPDYVLTIAMSFLVINARYIILGLQLYFKDHTLRHVSHLPKPSDIAEAEGLDPGMIVSKDGLILRFKEQRRDARTHVYWYPYSDITHLHKRGDMLEVFVEADNKPLRLFVHPRARGMDGIFQSWMRYQVRGNKSDGEDRLIKPASFGLIVFVLGIVLVTGFSGLALISGLLRTEYAWWVIFAFCGIILWGIGLYVAFWLYVRPCNMRSLMIGYPCLALTVPQKEMGASRSKLISQESIKSISYKRLGLQIELEEDGEYKLYRLAPILQHKAEEHIESYHMSENNREDIDDYSDKSKLG